MVQQANSVKQLVAYCPAGKSVLSAGLSGAGEGPPVQQFHPVLSNGSKPATGQTPTGWFLETTRVGNLSLYLFCY